MSSLKVERENFIDKMLGDVSSGGWNIDSAEKTSVDIYKNPEYWLILFPNILSIVEAFETSQDLSLSKMFDDKIKPEDSIRSKIAFCLVNRISICGLDCSRSLSQFYSQNFFDYKIRFLWDRAKFIWDLVGDQSIDYNYYSKRIILTRLYSKCWKYYVTHDPNHVLFSEFVEKEVNDLVATFSKFKNFKLSKIKDWPIIRMFM
jgi:ubiquinone biosynthesis protein COQ9